MGSLRVMSNIKSEFEKYFKENHADSFYSVDAALEMRGDDYIDFHAADLWELWQHQQSKVDELQKRIDGIKKIIREAYESDGNSSVEIVFDEVEQLEQALKGDQ